MLILHYHTEGTVSQIFNLGPSFYFMKFRKIGCKKYHMVPHFLS